MVVHDGKGSGASVTTTFAIAVFSSSSPIHCPNPVGVCWQRSAAHKRLRACATAPNCNDCCYILLQHFCSQVAINVVSRLFSSFPQMSSMVAPQSCKICSAVWKEMCSVPLSFSLPLSLLLPLLPITPFPLWRVRITYILPVDINVRTSKALLLISKPS